MAQLDDRPIEGADPIRASLPRARARTRWCAACSSRAPGPTARCTARRARLRLDTRDLALATQLELRHRPARGHARPRDRDAWPAGRSAKLDAPVLAALRLGVFQLTFLDRVPPHAAVGESVELAKADAPRGAGLVNAVLRRAVREARAARSTRSRTPRPARPRSPTRTPSGSRELWFDALGARDAARADGRRQRARRGRAARQHAQASPPAELAERLPVPTRASTGRGADPRRAVRHVLGRPSGSDGLLMPQSRAAMAVARVARPAARASACSTCAPRPAARRPTSPR